ncbi:MAG: hypothetical protein FGM58_06130 [Acidimicrobiia bacterium]|nr:hypothetical protein [Acidimicrobiia bacterium]
MAAPSSTKISTTRDFRRRQKVAAATDLPGVPAGTTGKVWFVSGVTWIRYHVVFDNGVELANVDGSQIVDRKVYLAAVAAETEAAQEAERAAAREVARARARAEALARIESGSSAGH